MKPSTHSTEARSKPNSPSVYWPRCATTSAALSRISLSGGADMGSPRGAPCCTSPEAASIAGAAQELGFELVEQRAGAVLVLRDGVLAVEKDGLLGEEKARAPAGGLELEGGDRDRDQRVVHMHLVGGDDALVADDVAVDGVVVIGRAARSAA